VLRGDPPPPMLKDRCWRMLTVNFHQPSHEFTFGVGMNLYLVHWY
jgi:hypothetical protein